MSGTVDVNSSTSKALSGPLSPRLQRYFIRDGARELPEPLGVSAIWAASSRDARVTCTNRLPVTETLDPLIVFDEVVAPDSIDRVGHVGDLLPGCGGHIHMDRQRGTTLEAVLQVHLSVLHPGHHADSAFRRAASALRSGALGHPASAAVSSNPSAAAIASRALRRPPMGRTAGGDMHCGDAVDQGTDGVDARAPQLRENLWVFWCDVRQTNSSQVMHAPTR